MASILEFKEIDLDNLEIDTGQVRTRNVATDLDELVDSINKVGLIEPIVVCPTEEPERYSIITGQRRFLAHRELQKSKIWAAVLDERLEEIDAKVLSVTENLVRKDLNSRDLMDVCTYLYKRYGTIKNVSEETGLPYERVRQYVKYDQLIDPLKALVDTGEVKVEVALRAQAAASEGTDSEPDEAEAVMFAREMSPMSGAQRQKIVQERRKNPTRSADDLIEDAKAGGKLIQVRVTLSTVIHEALNHYADTEGINLDDAAGKLIRDGLYVNDFIGDRE